MPAQILVVDDESSVAETIEELLTWEGHEVVLASNGQRALEMLAERAFDLLVIDFMMPLKDGVQTLREIRLTASLAALPVILMTAAPSSLPSDMPAPDALLVKPFSAEALLSAVKRALAK